MDCLADLEDGVGDAMDFSPLDDTVVRSELDGTLRNIDTCEDHLLPPPGKLGNKINISDDDQMLSAPSHSNFGRYTVSSGSVRLPFDDVPTGRNESIHAELATRESSSAGDASNMVLNSLASMSNHGVAASNASCPPIRHRHQSSLLRDVDAAEPSVDDSGRLSLYAPGNQPAEARSSHVVGQTQDMLEFTHSDVEDNEEVRHTGRGCASRRDDGKSSTSLYRLFGFRALPNHQNKGDDDDEVGNIRSKHGSMPTPQIIPHTIYNAFEDALGQNRQNFESRPVKRRRIMPEGSTSGSGTSSVISGRLNTADLESKLNPDEGAVPTSGSSGQTGRALCMLTRWTHFV